MPFYALATEYYVSEITLNPGQQVKVYLPDMYVEAMNNFGGGYPYSWSSDNQNICTATGYKSRTFCNIYAKTVGDTKLHYHGEYYRNGVIYDYDCYWDIKVIATGNNGDDSDTSGNDIVVPADSWDKSGNYNISWYKKNDKEFRLSSASEFAGLAYLINNKYDDFSGKSIILSDDIDLSGKKWTPIGTYDTHSFKGTLDGQGHTICYDIAEEENGNRAFGLFAYIVNAKIVNLNIICDIKVLNPMKKKGSQSSVVHIGGLAADAKNCIFENCNCNSTILYKRTVEGYFGYAIPDYVRLGGIVGLMHKCEAYYCTHDGNIKCIYGPRSEVNSYSEPVMVGGLFGDARSCKIYYCDNNSNLISEERQGTYSGPESRYKRTYYIAGIVGQSSVTDIYFCRNFCSFSVNYYGYSNYCKPVYYLGCVSNDITTIVNCYSVLSSLKMKTSGTVPEVNFGINIGSGSKSNYINADIVFDTNVSIIKKEDNASFSSEQMKTKTFLDELNIYSMLEMDEPVWVQGEDGYPINKYFYSPSAGIDDITVDEDGQQTIYSISGVRLKNPQKGLNIINGKKVVVK